MIEVVNLKPPLRLIVTADSALKRSDVSALAVNGYLHGLGESYPETPGGKYHGLGGACKRHRRVNRSTDGVRSEWVVGCMGASQE